MHIEKDPPVATTVKPLLRRRRHRDRLILGLVAFVPSLIMVSDEMSELINSDDQRQLVEILVLDTLSMKLKYVSQNTLYHVNKYFY